MVLQLQQITKVPVTISSDKDVPYVEKIQLHNKGEMETFGEPDSIIKKNK